jgi:hypothetical protein
MKHTRIITDITSKLRLPAALLEDLVNHRTRTTHYHYPVTGIEKDLYCSDLDTISTYSIQTSVKGNLELECFNDDTALFETVYLPVASSFLVTCVKGKEDGYKMELSSSLN